MDQITRQFRADNWARIISECMDSGLSIRRWCRENGIKEKTYHYWLRKLRLKQAESELPTPAGSNIPAPVFAEITVPGNTGHMSGAAAMLSYNGITIAFDNSASAELVSTIIGALTHV